MKAVRVIVTGRVQGVFFRGSCKREANKLHIVGWVTNKPDGTVEAMFQGDDKDVDKMVEWSKHGPSMAKVNHILIEPVSPDSKVDKFNIV